MTFFYTVSSLFLPMLDSFIGGLGLVLKLFLFRLLMQQTIPTIIAITTSNGIITAAAIDPLDIPFVGSISYAELY